MLDSQILKSNLKEFNENLKKRDISINVDLLIELEEKRRKAKFQAEQVRADKLEANISIVDKYAKKLGFTEGPTIFEDENGYYEQIMMDYNYPIKH